MRSKVALLGVAFAAAVLVATTFAAEASEATRSHRLVGATSSGGITQLVVFRSSDPGDVQTLTAIGLGQGEIVLGLDVRPDTGFLYAKTQECIVMCTSQLYVVQLNLRAGTATFSPTGAPFETTGDSFGFDFNPTVDRIRVISDSNENRRVHPDTGVPTVDMPLKYAVGDPNVGKDPDAVAAAYVPAAFGGTTTLYDVDAKQDVLVTQTPANDGLLQTVGSLGIDASSAAGLDIATGRSGPVALAALQKAGFPQSRLYRIDLASGNAKNLGPIGGGAPIEALAILAR